jgi:hypothetical protein
MFRRVIGRCCSLGFLLGGACGEEDAIGAPGDDGMVFVSSSGAAVSERLSICDSVLKVLWVGTVPELKKPELKLGRPQLRQHQDRLQFPR